MLTYTGNRQEYLFNDLENFKEKYNTVDYFNISIHRLINKIGKYSEIPPHITIKQLLRCKYSSWCDLNTHQEILNDMMALSGYSENITLYQLLINLGYNPFDGYMGEIKHKSFQQIILDNQEVFIPWFHKWGISYTPPLKDLEEFKKVYYHLISSLECLMHDTCEFLHGDKSPMRRFVKYGIYYLTNTDDEPEYWLYDNLDYSISSYDYVVYEFILLKNIHKIIKQCKPSFNK